MRPGLRATVRTTELTIELLQQTDAMWHSTERRSLVTVILEEALLVLHLGFCVCRVGDMETLLPDVKCLEQCRIRSKHHNTYIVVVVNLEGATLASPHSRADIRCVNTRNISRVMAAQGHGP